MLATGIMAIVILSFGTAIERVIGTNVFSNNKSLAYNDAKRIMEQIRYLADTQGLTSVANASYWSNNGGGWLETQSFSSLPNAVRSVQFPDGTSGEPLHVRVLVRWKEKKANRKLITSALITPRTWAGGQDAGTA
jgi:hypothetical protein